MLAYSFDQAKNKLRVGQTRSKICDVSFRHRVEIGLAAIEIPLIEGLHCHGSGKMTVGHRKLKIKDQNVKLLYHLKDIYF